MTNNKEIARALNLQCSNDHEHSHIIGSDEGGKISAQSQKYPQGLIDKVLKPTERTPATRRSSPRRPRRSAKTENLTRTMPKIWRGSSAETKERT
jgi:hypothetical protein